ncbi:hypothetical protein [Granulicella sibirica]|nr:hypothetical protein [Granulicella sibirica]
MATFPITVDATALSNTAYLIIGPPTGFNIFPPNSSALGWTANSQAYTVSMETGDYLFQIESGGVNSFHFQISATGTITYAAEYAAFLSGEGTSELRVLGYKVQLDARYITGQVFWSGNLAIDNNNLPIPLETFNLIPLDTYKVSASDENDWAFGVDNTGKVFYDQSFDYAQGGFLQGAGTTKLTLLGYPLLIDARNAGEAGVRISSDTGVPFATSGVTYANLLPGCIYVLEFEDGVLSSATFRFSDVGVLTLTHQLPWVLSLDKFHGVPRLTVNRVTLAH